MKRIVYTIGTLLTGGAEVFVVNLIKNLNKEIYNIDLIVLDKKNNTFLEAEVERLGINVWYLNKPPGFSLKTYFLISKVLRKIKPNIIHGNIGGIIYALAYLFFHKNVKAVHTIHTSARIEFGKVKRLILKCFYLRKRIIPVVLSNNSFDEFIDTYKINKNYVYVINNGIDVDRFACLRNFYKEEITIGHVGRFEEVKNHKLIVSIFEKLNIKGYGVSLRLVGKGSLFKKIQERLMNKNVEFVLETAKIEEELEKIDIFLFPSLYEGLPLSLIEAMASGCVIVASSVGGINDLIVDGKNGYKIKNYDVDEYVKIIEMLINDRNLMETISLNNKLDVQKYSIKKTLMLYEELYLKE